MWRQCGSRTQSDDLLAHAGGFDIVVLDLAGVPVKQARRISLASWFRLRHAVKDTPTALVVVAQEVNAHSCSTLQIEHRPIRSEVRGKLLRGIGSKTITGPRQQLATDMRLEPLYKP
jgi:hypothetical protein